MVDKSLPDRPNGIEDAKTYWSQIDAVFYRTIGHAEQSYRVNLYVNLLIVGAGCLLLIYSFSYSALRGIDVWSVAFGGLGIVSFLGSFFILPQQRIQKTVGDLTQIQIFYRTYCAQWENIMDWEKTNKDHMTLQELESLNKQLEELTFETVKRIEEYVGGTK